MTGYRVHRPACGNTWRSTSVSGVTRCGECRTRVYVPVDERPRRYVEEQRARRRTYGKAAAAGPTRRGGRRRDPDEYDPDDPLVDLNALARRTNERREALGKVTKRRPSATPRPPLATALASLLKGPSVTARSPVVPAPARPVRSAARRSQRASGVPPPKRTHATLACGHIVILGGAPAAWYGVAVWCPNCGGDVNVERVADHRARARPG